jgi:hypothetical protein
MKVFGVIIEMSQLEPYKELAPDDRVSYRWEHDLFGHFDEMSLWIETDIMKFSTAAAADKLRNLPDEKHRMHFHAETQKTFLYFQEDNNDEKSSKIDFLKKYQTGMQPYQFTALVSVKPRHQFIAAKRCGICECVKNFLEREKVYGFLNEAEYCVMNSLSFDDAYVLIGTDNPKDILELAHKVNLRSCNGNCNNQAVPDSVIRKSIITASKTIKKLLSEEDAKQYAKAFPCVNECLNIILSWIDNAEDYRDCNVLIDRADPLRKYIESQRYTKEPDAFKKLLWHINCYNAVRMCGPLPVVLSTNTVIGYQRGLTKDKLHKKDVKIAFEMQMQTKPGANFIYATKAYREKFDIALGRYDLSWKGNSLEDLIGLYKNFFRGHHPLRQGARHILLECDKNYMLQPEDECVIKTQEEMFIEDSLLSNAWAIEGHRKAVKLFRKLRKDASKYPFLDPLINEMDKLHMQGCSKLFYAMHSHEFEDARKFFDQLYDILADLFDELNDSNNQLFHAKMIASGLEQILKDLSALFHDRMILDIYENTRPTLYATGAYENVLKRYSDWIKDLRSILCKLENNNNVSTDRLDFLLVPVERDTIHSDNLFPLSVKEPSIITYATTFDNMLNIHNALPLFTHEVGHYWGIVGRIERVKTFWSMVAYFYSVRLTRGLCLHSYSKITTNAVRTYTEQLADSLQKYFIYRGSNEVNGCHSLDIVEKYCKEWIDDFVERVIYNPSSEEERNLVEKFVKLYRGLGCTHLICKEGKLLASLSEEVTNYDIDLCKSHVRESYSDIIMIRLLKMSTEDYFRVFLSVMIENSNQLSNISDNIEERGQLLRDSARILSALLQLDDDTEKMPYEVLNEIPQRVQTVTNTVSQMFIDNRYPLEWKTKWEALRDTMVMMVEKTEYHKEAREVVPIWRLSAPYLYRSGQEIERKLKILEKEPDSVLHKIRSLYRNIMFLHNEQCGDNTMRQLLLLLNKDEEG